MTRFDSIVSAFTSAWSGALEDFFPPTCLVCGRELAAGSVCTEHRLPRCPPGGRCGRCQTALPPGLPDGYRCAGCARAAPGFRSLVCLADYRGQPGVREWILGLKHGARADLAPALGSALARRLGETPLAGVAGPLVPVPSHPLRRFERGIDQTLLLAHATAEASGRNVLRLLRRTRATPVQGGPGSVSRGSNVRGAFSLRRVGCRPTEAPPDAILVDDVVTSGSTAAECARVLRRGGVRRVHVLCIARA